MNIKPRKLKDGTTSLRCEFMAGKDPATGKYRRVVETVEGTQREAERYWRRRQVEIDAQGARYAKPSKTTLGDYLERWLAAKTPDLRPTTAASYKGMIAHHIAPRLCHCSLGDLTAAAVQEMLDAMRGTVGGHGKPNVTAPTMTG